MKLKCNLKKLFATVENIQDTVAASVEIDVNVIDDDGKSLGIAKIEKHGKSSTDYLFEVEVTRPLLYQDIYKAAERHAFCIKHGFPQLYRSPATCGRDTWGLIIQMNNIKVIVGQGLTADEAIDSAIYFVRTMK